MLILPAAFPLFRYVVVSLLYSTAVRNRGSAGPGGYSSPAAKPCFASAVSGEPRRAWLMGCRHVMRGHPRGFREVGSRFRVRIDCAARDASRI